MKNAIASRALVLAVLSALVAGSISAYVLLSPRRTWDNPPNIIVDNRGQSSITDGDGGTSRTVAAITSNQAWNGAGQGTVLTATAGSVAGWQLGDGQAMLNFTDPERVCTGTCLAATFTGFYGSRGDGTYRINDADIVTNTSYNWTSEGESDGCSSEFFIEGVQVHEVGHLLGLGHSNVTGSTMYPSVSSCNNNPATTEADDDNAINDLYGSSGPTCSARGASCTSNSQCCSNRCQIKRGVGTCR
ncbi:MAG TPA: matrixin family metalloprotease [Thermoanaerobaculia bacterium]|nr:matrixin family metalloprotease [Thermoanaerobaculia bacterium]HSN89204.1 matrixin family metalloprotease [Thermoanaerobaculia bacterium]